MKHSNKIIVALLIILCGYSAASQVRDEGVTSKDGLSRNKALAIRFCDEVINKQRVDLIDSLIAPDYIEHQADRHYLNTRYGLKRGLRNFLHAFPDVHVKINFVTEDNNLVTTQYTITGTHTGRMYQHRATNRKIHLDGVDVIRIENGKLKEHWGYMEEAKLLRQLRVRPDRIEDDDIMMVKPTVKGGD